MKIRIFRRLGDQTVYKRQSLIHSGILEIGHRPCIARHHGGIVRLELVQCLRWRVDETFELPDHPVMHQLQDRRQFVVRIAGFGDVVANEFETVLGERMGYDIIVLP